MHTFLPVLSLVKQFFALLYLVLFVVLSYNVFQIICYVRYNLIIFMLPIKLFSLIIFLMLYLANNFIGFFFKLKSLFKNFFNLVNRIDYFLNSSKVLP